MKRLAGSAELLAWPAADYHGLRGPPGKNRRSVTEMLRLTDEWERLLHYVQKFLSVVAARVVSVRYVHLGRLR